MVRALVLAALAASLCGAGLPRASADEAFVTNQLSDDLMVVDLATARGVATIPIGGSVTLRAVLTVSSVCSSCGVVVG